MRTLLTRTFEVEAAPAAAWAHLERVERWTSWAKHIRSATLEPPGPLTPTSRGTFKLSNGIKTSFSMTDLVPGRRWRWAGTFLWLRVGYDHLLEAAPGGGTRVTFVVEGEGLGLGSLGRLFARVYAKNLDVAIPNLVEELRARAR